MRLTDLPLNVIQHSLAFLGDLYAVLGLVCRDWRDLLAAKKKSIHWHALLYAMDGDDRLASLLRINWLRRYMGMVVTPTAAARMVVRIGGRHMEWTIENFFGGGGESISDVWKILVGANDLTTMNAFYAKYGIEDAGQSVFDHAVGHSSIDVIEQLAEWRAWEQSWVIPTDIPTIKYVLTNGYIDRNRLDCILDTIIHTDDVEVVADMFPWFNENVPEEYPHGGRWQDYHDIIVEVIKVDNVEILHWILDNEFTIGTFCYRRIINYVTNNQLIEVPRCLTHLVDNGYRFNAAAYQICVPIDGDVCCLFWRDWLHSIGCPPERLSTSTYSAIISDEHLPILQWYIAKGFTFDLTLLQAAMNGGHKKVVKWLVDADHFDAGQIDTLICIKYSHRKPIQTAIRCLEEPFLIWAWQSGYLKAETALAAAQKQKNYNAVELILTAMMRP